ncbi:bifunctional DNA primase/polymerase [bacterium]|nr:bifunctional DNA primase/polymerase [bacterium]
MIKRETLEAFLKAGMSIIPLRADKRPNLKSWQKYNKELYKLKKKTDEFESVGLITGTINQIECVDIDEKYNIAKEGLKEKLKEKVDLFAPDLWNKLVIASTVNKGFHLIYKVKEMGGNVKLAMREATKKEAAKGEKKLVLIETRSQHGYIVVKPSKGYEIIQGKLFGLNEITVKERDTLFACCRMLDEILPPVFMKDPNVTWGSKGISPWEDFNSRGDWKSILTANQWTIVSEKGTKTNVKRPNSTSPISGNFDSKYNLLRVFSSSSVFDTDKSYSPFGIYTVLVAGGDYKQAARELKEAGYGRTPEPEFKRVDEVVDLVTTEDFISGSHDNSMLEKFATGQIKPGLSTGYTRFDEFYRFKPGKFEVVGGAAGLGKSTIVWLLAAISNALHGWKWIIYSCENEAWEIKKDLAEFLVGENYQKIPKEHRDVIIKYIDENFKIIETSERMSYRTVLEKAEKLMETGTYNALMIDPYNKLKIDFTEVDRKLSTYEYHYEVAGIFKQWCNNTKCSIYLNMHGNSSANRRTHQAGEMKGHRMAYEASDLEHGSMWENAVDSLIMIHRYKYHAELKFQTQIAIKKMRSQYSGGTETPLEDPVVIKMGRGSDRNFYSFYDERNETPLKNWFKKTILGETKTKEELTEDFNTTRTQIAEETPDALAEQNFARGTVFKQKIEEPPF